MRGAAVFTVFGLIGAVSCADRVAEIERGPGAAIAVSLDPSGEWIEARFLPPGERLSVEAEEGSLLILYELDLERLLDRAGSPLGPEVFDRLRAEDGAAPSGSPACGRCRVPESTALRLGSGDLCSLPASTPGRVFRLNEMTAKALDDPVLLSAIRTRVRLGWPGACDTASPDLERPTPLTEICGLTPVDAPIRARQLAVDPGGTVVAARSGFAAFIGPSGAGATLRLPSAYLGEMLPPPTAGGPFTLAAGALLQLNLLGGLRAVQLPPGFADARGLALLEPDTLHVLGASATGGGPAVARCSLDVTGAAGVCLSERIDCALSDPLVDAAPVPGGGAIAVGIGGLVLRRGPGSRWSCDPRDRLQLDGASGFRPTRVEALETLGDRLFVCADGLDGGVPGAVGILSASLSTSPLRFEVVDAGPGFACNSFARVPGRQDRLLALGAVGGATLLDASGRSLGRCDAALSCLPSVVEAFWPAAQHGIVGLAAAPNRVAAAVDFSGRVHRLDRGARSSRVVYGDPNAQPFASVALAGGPSGTWVFSGASAPRRYEAAAQGCDGARLVPAEPEGGWSLDEGSGERSTGAMYPGTRLDRARAATFTPDGFLVAGESLGEGAGWLRRVDPQSGRVRARSIPSAQAPLQILSLPGGRALWLTAGGLFSVPPSGLELEPVPLRWDDPTTEAEESAPADFNGSWRTATGSADVVWAFGPGRVARVLVGPDGAIEAEAWWSRAGALGQPFGSRDIWAAAALEPDRVVTLERVYGFDGRAEIRFGLLGPECAGAGRALGHCRAEEGLAAITERRPEAPGPMRLHADGLTVTTFVEGIVFRSDTARFAPFGFIRDAVPVEDGLLLAGWGAAAVARVDAP